jgi:hypothetical protein
MSLGENNSGRSNGVVASECVLRLFETMLGSSIESQADKSNEPPRKHLNSFPLSFDDFQRKFAFARNYTIAK